MSTPAGPPITPEHLHAHAAQIEALRSRITLIRLASGQIGWDTTVFGQHCGPFPAVLNSRNHKHKELIGRLEENLAVIVRNIRRTAAGELPFAALTGNGDDDLEPQQTMRGIMDGVNDRITRWEWVEPLLSIGAPVPEFAQPVDPTYAALRTAALNAAIAGIPALRQLLNDQIGFPDIVAHRAACWNLLSGELHRVSDELRDCLDRDFAGRRQPGVRAYLVLMSYNVGALAATAAITNTLALITRTAGRLILLTHDIIRGLIGNLGAHLIIWINDSTLVPLRTLAAQLAVTAWRIHRYQHALAISLTRLAAYLEPKDPNEEEAEG